jgi:hypothetical protein
MTRPVPIILKRVGLGGKPDYEYDRGRDLLTEREWDIFVDRAYWEMMDGAKRIMAKDMMDINKDLAPTEPIKKDKDDQYNPYDPISCRVHQMKEEQKYYNLNMEFFKHAFRYKMNEEQFNSWWFGTPLNNSQNMTADLEAKRQAQAREAWVSQMTDRNMAILDQFVPFDPMQEREWANTQLANAIHQFTKGSVTQDMNLYDYMANMGYLYTRMHEMELEKQQAEATRQQLYMSGRQTYQQALQNFATYGPGWMGTTNDPRSPQNGEVVNLNSMLQTPQFRQFEQHCQTQKGHVPLSAVYR